MKNRKDFWVPWFIIWGIFIGAFLLFGTIAYFCCDNPDCNHRFLMVKITSQIFICTTAILAIIFHFINYFGMNKANNNSVKMKFRNFKDVYYVNPKRWCIYKGFLLYRYKYDYWHEDSYRVTFSYFDWLKFRIWLNADEYNKNLEAKRKKKEASNERMAEMLKYIQADINKAYEKINQEEEKEQAK